MSLTEAQKVARVGRLTGSRFASAIGLGFRTPYQMWEMFTGGEKLPDREDVEEENEEGEENPFIPLLGTWGEVAIRLWYERENPDLKIYRPGKLPGNTIAGGMMYVHPEHSWIATSPDGVVGDGEIFYPMEIKIPREESRPNWFNGVPPVYRVQSFVHMACMGASKCLVLAYLGGSYPSQFVVDWDEDEWAGYLKLAKNFMNFVKTKTPPPMMAKDRKKAKLLFARNVENTAWLEDKTGKVDLIAASIIELANQKDYAEEQLGILKTNAMRLIGATAGIRGNDFEIAKFKNNVIRARPKKKGKKK